MVNERAIHNGPKTELVRTPQNAAVRVTFPINDAVFVRTNNLSNKEGREDIYAFAINLGGIAAALTFGTGNRLSLAGEQLANGMRGRLVPGVMTGWGVMIASLGDNLLLRVDLRGDGYTSDSIFPENDVIDKSYNPVLHRQEGELLVGTRVGHMGSIEKAGQPMIEISVEVIEPLASDTKNPEHIRAQIEAASIVGRIEAYLQQQATRRGQVKDSRAV